MREAIDDFKNVAAELELKYFADGRPKNSGVRAVAAPGTVDVSTIRPHFDVEEYVLKGGTGEDMKEASAAAEGSAESTEYRNPFETAGPTRKRGLKSSLDELVGPEELIEVRAAPKKSSVRSAKKQIKRPCISSESVGLRLSA